MAFDCTTGAQVEHHRVDLNDESTFVRDSFKRRVIGTREALTADNLAISEDELVRRGYPARPDPAAAPDLYAKWVKRLDSVLVAVLGTTAGAVPNGSRYGGSMNWTGLVQSVNGFTTRGMASPNNTTYEPIVPNANSASATSKYIFYEYSTQAPSPNCSGQSKCVSALWGGIGGYPEIGSKENATLFDGILIQSGFHMYGTNQVSMFVEVVPYSPKGIYDLYFGPDDDGDQIDPAQCTGNICLFSPGDDFVIAGWSSAAQDGSSASSPFNYACFVFDDITVGWTTTPAPFQTPVDLVGGQSLVYTGTTAEWVVEQIDAVNPDYQNEYIQGAAYDPGWGTHTAQTDGYVFVDQNNNAAQHSVSTASFTSVSQLAAGQVIPDTSPQSTVWLYWDQWQ